MIPSFVLLSVLLVLSAFFSGSETAFFSLNHIEREQLLQGTRGARKKFLSGILHSPAEILITILTGNMVVNLFFASLMEGVVGHYFHGDLAWLYSILIGTGLILIFGEMTPKNLAIRQSLGFFRGSSRLLRLIHVAITPLRTVLNRVEKAVVTLLSQKLHPEPEDVRSIISSTFQVGHQRGLLHRSELSVLESFLDFREKTAEDVMAPRTELQPVEVSTPMNELIGRITDSRDESLIPVLRDDIDHIVGYINLRDILPFRYGISKARTIATIIRPVHPVPESKNLMELLRELINKNCEMALVIDEYGGTAGIVTFQNLVEDFLYFFYPSKTEFQVLDQGRYLFPGNIALEKVSDLLSTELESENRTLSGYIIERIEDIPAVGAELSIDGNTLIVKKVSRRKVLEVEVRKTT